MREQAIVGQRVVIKSKKHWANGEWGIVTHFDGELYHVAMYGGTECQLVFSRNELKLKS